MNSASLNRENVYVIVCTAMGMNNRKKTRELSEVISKIMMDNLKAPRASPETLLFLFPHT